MTRFIIRRLLVTIPVLFGLVFLVFVLARVVPGDPCRAVLGERATDAVCDAFIVRYGLDQPIPVQFGIYLGQLAQGDLGTSIKHSRPVTQLLIERLPTTVELSVLALIFAIVIGVPLGIASAIRRNSPIDVGAMVTANLGVSMPVFVLGLFLQFIFALLLKNTFLALPASGRLSAGVSVEPLVEVWGMTGTTGIVRGILDFFSGIYTFSAAITGQWGAWLDAVRHLILPAIALGTIPLAIIARITRSSLLETLGQDYVRTARAKGLRERWVVIRHATRNALLPVVTVVGLQFGALFSGAVLTESTFNLAGVGRTLFEAISGRDYVVIQGFILIVAVAYVVVNLIVDISYGYLDPRIRPQ
ncbi:MAG TPA: ABC transporter permease [Candidatus Limnocylindrales bacterium]|nr:ABC transporter permease [Candidatus Limnocylindrales bacterium]